MKVIVDVNEKELIELKKWYRAQALLLRSGLLPDITVLHVIVDRILIEAGILTEK